MRRLRCRVRHRTRAGPPYLSRPEKDQSSVINQLSMASLQQPRSTPFSFLPPCLFGGPAGRSGDGANSEQRQGPRQCVCLCFPKQTAARRRVWQLGVGATRPGAPPSDADAGQTCGRTATACREQLSHPPPPAGAVEEVRSRSVAGLTANSGTAGVTHSRAGISSTAAASATTSRCPSRPRWNGM